MRNAVHEYKYTHQKIQTYFPFSHITVIPITLRLFHSILSFYRHTMMFYITQQIHITHTASDLDCFECVA